MNSKPGTKGFVQVPLADRFWAKVDRRGEDECWPWLGANRSSDPERAYGMVWVDGRNRPAHRMAWELTYGMEMPLELDACHTCDHPWCVNPTHVFPGTAKDNAQDALRKNRLVPYRRNPTHCKRGHSFSGDNVAFDHRGHRRCVECKRLLNAARYT